MPALEIHSEWAKTQAEQLVASGDAPPVGLSDDERLALAWALKDLAISAWSASPVEVPKIANMLRLLSDMDEHDPAESSSELRAVAAWIAGIAALTSSELTDAIIHLENAALLFRSLGQNAQAAHTQVSQIVALGMLGRHADAATCGMSTQRELMYLGEFHSAGKVSLNLGNLFCRQNLYQNALTQYADAAMLFRRTNDHNWEVMTQIGAANAYESMGNFDRALSMYSTTIGHAKQHGLHAHEAVVKESIALLHLARGNLRDALSGLESARLHYEKLGMTQNLANAEKQLADTYLAVRLVPEALVLLNRAVVRFGELEMPVEQAWAQAQRGRALVALGYSFEKISEALLKASNLFSSQGISAGEAVVLLARAEFALSIEETELACRLAGDAAKMFTNAHMVAGRAEAEVVQAHTLLADGKTAEATVLFNETLGRARDTQLLSIQVRCKIGLGLALARRGETQAAKLAFETAIISFEEQREALAGDDLRHAFLVDHLRPYEELLRIALCAHDQSPSTSQADEVLIRLEQFRARALGERLGDSRERNSATDADGIERDLRARLNWLHRRAEKLLNEGENNQALLDDVRQIEFELLERARRRRLTAAASGSPSEREALRASALQAALARDDALVEYGVLDDELFACVVTNSGVALKRGVAKWTDVVETIHTARFQIETLRNGAGELDKHFDLLTRRSQIALRRLHDLIWAPLADLLMGCHRVLVVPHEKLGSVPFAALHDGKRYLPQLYELAVAPSARVALRGLGLLPVAAKHAVIVGESSRLLHAAEEAQFVASLFDEATVLTGQDANGDALRAASVQADVLHLACHGQFRSDNPMFSALHLVDGPFTVQDAEALRLPQGIVVLSACDSGVATASKGDEVIGLVRAFLIAGAARVVASLWPVDDAVTTEFMAVFYSSLRAGVAPAAALRCAQLEVMKTHPHPFHWAAFAVYGGW